MNAQDLWSIVGLGWLVIGVIWFVYVIVVSGGRITEGTLVGCILGWPFTLTGYLIRLKTGKRNIYDPLDMTDFAEEYRKEDEEAERQEYERLKEKFENKNDKV